jgi:hypothetical protein
MAAKRRVCLDFSLKTLACPPGNGVMIFSLIFAKSPVSGGKT